MRCELCDRLENCERTGGRPQGLAVDGRTAQRRPPLLWGGAHYGLARAHRCALHLQVRLMYRGTLYEPLRRLEHVILGMSSV